MVRALVGRGWTVRPLVRDRRKARAVLESDESAWVQGDALDHGALAALLGGASAVVHCIGIRREFPPEVTFARLHPGATRALLDAAAEAGVRRFVHISALGTRPDAATPYHRSKYESERLVRESGLDWTILRPSLVHGPHGEFVRMARAWVLGRAPPWFFLPYFGRFERPGGGGLPRLVSAKVQPVHVDDVAHAVCACLERDESIGEVYPLAGPETLDWPGVLTAIRDAMPMGDKRKRPAAMPGALASAMARGAGAIGLGALLPFGPSEPIMATEDNTCALDKARAHLDFRPAAFVESVRAYGGGL